MNEPPTPSRVLIIGGYGHFGSFIARSLASDQNIQLVICGRSRAKARSFIASLDTQHPAGYLAFDINSDVDLLLAEARADIVIHTAGPFQGQDYRMVSACIRNGCHYIDLADGRAFVAHIDRLDQEARDAGVLVVSGASSLPCLSSALVDHYRPYFAPLESIDYGISTAQQTTRGLATTAAILSYVGKPFASLNDGRMEKVYGWQDIHARAYRGLGRRFLGRCDVPDLTLFPARYPGLRTQRFYAGTELAFIHTGLFALSWLVRIGLIRGFHRAAPALLRLSQLFDRFGNADSGFHMELEGLACEGHRQLIRFELVARSGDGPFIPCIPSILLARWLASGSLQETGARPCLELIKLDDYLGALAGLAITWHETREQL